MNRKRAQSPSPISTQRGRSSDLKEIESKVMECVLEAYSLGLQVTTQFVEQLLAADTTKHYAKQRAKSLLTERGWRQRPRPNELYWIRDDLLGVLAHRQRAKEKAAREQEARLVRHLDRHLEKLLSSKESMSIAEVQAGVMKLTGEHFAEHTIRRRLLRHGYQNLGTPQEPQWRKG